MACIAALVLGVFQVVPAQAGEGKTRVMVQFRAGQGNAVKHALEGTGAEFHYAFENLNAFAVSLPANAIEEIDILDLQKQAVLSTHEDILLVYDNLEKGSRNHLRSFVTVLQSQAGETYQLQHLSVDAYQAIVGTAIESAGNGRGSIRP